MHQNRAIPCGCGGDFYRSEKKSLRFFSSCSLRAKPAPHRFCLIQAQEGLFCWQNYWQIQHFCALTTPNPWKMTVFRCDDGKTTGQASSFVQSSWEIQRSMPSRREILGKHSIVKQNYWQIQQCCALTPPQKKNQSLERRVSAERAWWPDFIIRRGRGTRTGPLAS